MATALRLSQRSTPLTNLNRNHLCFSLHRWSSTLTTTTTTTTTSGGYKSSHHKDHSHNQVYLNPSTFVGSWEFPNDPDAAQAKLDHLRRDYAKQVKELRKNYIYEMELQRQEKIRKDEARREEVLRRREERKKSKAAAAQARAAERKAFEDDFRQTLMKERAEKLQYWRMRKKAIEEKRSSKNDLIHRQSSIWIDENELEDKIDKAIVDSTGF